VFVRLRIPSRRSRASAEAAGRALRIESRGHLRTDYVVHDETTGEDVAHLRRAGRQLLLELDGRVVSWKRLGRKEGYGFVTPEGKSLVRATSRSGLARISGELQIDSDLNEQAALIAALLASYLLIRRHQDAAASVAVTTALAAP
jgi:hypothetical protein